jgi:four helix bundle protein
MGTYKELIAYQKAYSLALIIQMKTKTFPAEERYDLISQIRRSARSVCSNFAEAYSRRNYPDHFRSKLNDCQAENCEVQVWLDFSKDCGFLNTEEYNELSNLNAEVGRLLRYMISNLAKFM